jgi:hypothetical protein
VISVFADLCVDGRWPSMILFHLCLFNLFCFTLLANHAVQLTAFPLFLTFQLENILQKSTLPTNRLKTKSILSTAIRGPPVLVAGSVTTCIKSEPCQLGSNAVYPECFCMARFSKLPYLQLVIINVD